MNSRRFVLRSLVHHRRTHLGAFLTAALTSAVILAALGVGDSVRSSMAEVARARLGGYRFAAHAPGRLWREELGEAVGADAALMLSGSVALPDGSARLNGARVIGWPRDGVAVSESVAARLGVTVGDSIVIRVERPATVPRDAPLSSESDAVATLLVEVAEVLDARRLGTFSLSIGPIAPANVFLPLRQLQEAVGEAGMINTLLAEAAPAALAEHVRIEDYGLTLDPELHSRRVFLEDPVAEAALGIPGASGVLTWLVNDLRFGERSTPYSMVAGLPGDLVDDEIDINEWLAGDLGAKVDDTIALTYFVISAGRRLTERTSEFRIRRVVPIEADPGLVPEFPGLTDSENCRDWDPGLPLDLTRIRDQDEAYWDEHGATPKAYVSLSAGQKSWGNRFGKLTAVRFPEGTDPEAVRATLHEKLDPAAFGLSFVDVRAAAAASRSEGMDFAALFLGFSAFLIGAALLLMGLVVALNVAMRRGEIATLLALGFTRRRVRRLFAFEHALVALGGGVLGVAFGIALLAAALSALETVWSDVAGSLPMAVVVRPGTLVAGALGGAAVSFGAAWLVLWRSVGRSPNGVSTAPGRLPVVVALVLAVAAVALGLAAGTGRDPATAGAFFGSGMLLLAACLALAFSALARAGLARGLAWRNLGRRRGRSVAVIGVLAFGVFMFLGVTVFKRDRLTAAGDRASGTGGFALVGESSVALVELPEIEDVRVTGLRVRAGDDASCLSLTRAQAPEIVGVDPRALSGRFTFVSGDAWSVLEAEAAVGAVPAVIDQATFWTLGKGFGGVLELEDEAGRPLAVRIAGVIDNAVLHGRLVISEQAFVARFPSEGGYRRFLIEVPPERTDEVAARLTRKYEDYGLSLTRAEVRLNTLNAVENTYLGIFQALGGIGLLLGSAGLALVVGRNVVERRSELALLGAVGFPRRRIVRLVTVEHAVLLLLGLAAGLAASVLSLLPALLAPGASVATPGMAAVLLGLAAGGILWTRLAARAALRGSLLGNLREE